MCDFRHDPTGVRVINTGEIFPVETVWLNGIQDMNTVMEAGMYGIPATGSFVAYYDGMLWHHDGNHNSEFEFLRPEGFKMIYGDIKCGELTLIASKSNIDKSILHES